MKREVKIELLITVFGLLCSTWREPEIQFSDSNSRSHPLPPCWFLVHAIVYTDSTSNMMFGIFHQRESRT